MEFQIQWARIIELNATGRSNRMQKLQEEQGELATAILLGRRQDIMSESIDVLLMLLSIYADHNVGVPGFSSTIASHLHYGATELETKGASHGDNIISRYLELSGCIGKVAELNQKLDGVASSTYKMTDEETPQELGRERLMVLFSAILHTLRIIVFLEMPIEDVQAEYDRKMDKWERVSTPNN